MSDLQTPVTWSQSAASSRLPHSTGSGTKAALGRLTFRLRHGPCQQLPDQAPEHLIPGSRSRGGISILASWR